ncbi:hypothetical protein SCLCIDRAFT_1216370 [Scleroderma citrinum Foug A]|uniref:Uncharacterized protein n=1 Tax=Scleroderma citrinum Foug A TaxID=1036808 RepID=A0A0C2ZHD9_9AGAM|nr:hypothetical protein SCLCIDRAFT_1216370 [Scleroderma citrinum Foug A]
MSAPLPITVTLATPTDASEQRITRQGETDCISWRRSISRQEDATNAQGPRSQRTGEDQHDIEENWAWCSKEWRATPQTIQDSNSAADFHAVLQNHQYQASSIHSRRRLRAFMRGHHVQPVESPPAPPPPTLPPVQEAKTKADVTREDKLLSDLWAASAATFRRQGKIDQAKGAIQEAEVKNPDNPSVWVQFGLYHYALNHERQAIDALQKTLFISPEDVPAQSTGVASTSIPAHRRSPPNRTATWTRWTCLQDY